MTGKISLLTFALALLSPVGMAFAQSDDSATCNTMLETAIGQELQAEGYDTSNACSLTLNQLVQIKSLLDDNDDGSENERQIRLILSRAAE